MEPLEIDYSISPLRMKEVSDLTGIHLPNLNSLFKGSSTDEVKRGGNRLLGVYPNALEKLLTSRGMEIVYRPGVVLNNSQCGGIGKTTSTINMAYAFARLSNREDYPIILMDLDSQASMTLQLLGEINEEMPVLTDYIEGRVKNIKKLLIPVGDNIFLLPSSLDNGYLEKHISGPKQVKETGLKILTELFETCSKKGRLKIFIDSPPALSSVTATFLVGMNRLGKEFEKTLCIPIRPDKFAIKGCEIALNELEDLLSTFTLKPKIRIIPFMNFYQQSKNSVTGMQKTLENPTIAKYELSPIVIRKSDEISAKMMSNRHIYSAEGYKPSPITKDYQDLMLLAMGWIKE